MVQRKGQAKGTRSIAYPAILRRLEFPDHTALAHIESHHLTALILDDLRRHPGTAIGEIHERIGREIRDHQVRRQLKSLVD